MIVSGGIGPTHDDVSRPAMARALGVPLETHPEAEARIRGFYGALTTTAELEMARLPRGSRLVHGPRTGTFGFAVSGLYGFPGVPFLLKDLTDAIVPEFRGAPLSRAEILDESARGRDRRLPHRDAARRARGRDRLVPGLHRRALDRRVVVRGEDPDRVGVCERGLRQPRGISRGHGADERTGTIVRRARES